MDSRNNPTKNMYDSTRTPFQNRTDSYESVRKTVQIPYWIYFARSLYISTMVLKSLSTLSLIPAQEEDQ